MQNSPEIIVTNMKKRYSGVTGTVNVLLPVQSENLHVGFLGTDMPGVEIAQQKHPNTFTRLSLMQAIKLSCKRLSDGRKRIWHVRRDPEMMLSIFLRDVLRLPISIVFTSAAKHRHSWFPRWLISKMDGVISTTPEAASFVPNTTRVVPHGASLERFSPPNDKLTIWSRTGLPGKYGIGVFGRVRPTKGTDIYVDAMLKVLPKYPDFTAVIVGLCHQQHAQFQQELVNKIRLANLSERIIFLGEVPIDEVPVWYQNVLIAVACPRYEPFGITPLEAMASSCAIVASDTGAFRMIVEEDKTGHVVPTGDVNTLAQALEKYMRNPKEALLAGQLGRERVKTMFSVEKEAEGIKAVYNTVWEK